MSRVIKFRVWDKTKNQWITNKVAINGDGDIFIVLPGNIIINLDKSHVDIQFFTGLLDAKGVEIYEGDIVSFEDYEYGINTQKVEWVEGSTGWSPFCSYRHYEYTPYEGYYLGDSKDYIFQVIGNIHQNPELISGEKG